MKESYGEGLANHTSLESCGNCSNAVAEALTERNIVMPAAVRTQGRGAVSIKLQGVRRKAQQDKDVRFNNLFHHITVDLLTNSFYSLKKNAAAVVETGKWLNSVIRGFQNYYAVPGNMNLVKSFYDQTTRAWLHTLRRRRQKGRNFTWKRFEKLIRWLIPRVRMVHPFPNQRFQRYYPR